MVSINPNTRLSFVDSHVKVDVYQWDVRFKILDALLYDDRVLIILDYMSFPPDAAAPNLEAYTLNGERIWIAENPGSGARDAYTNFYRVQPRGDVVIVNNFDGFECTIRVNDGKLLKSKETK